MTELFRKDGRLATSALMTQGLAQEPGAFAKMPNRASSALPRRPVMCVDLEGALLTSDIMWESLVLLIKTRPLKLLFLPLWLWRGKAYLKQQICRHVVLSPAKLPYREDVLQFLRREKAEGRKIVLATGWDRRAAEAVGQHVGLFSAILASDGVTNLIGRQKLTAVRNYGGEDGFSYLGKGEVDHSLWKAATEVLLVQPSARLLKQIENEGIACQILSPRSNRLSSLVRALRIYQWIKNGLLFVPLVLAHRIVETEQLLLLLYAFLSFSLCASSVYVANDLFDLEADRQHQTKKFRPFADGTLPISIGLILAPLLIVLSFVIALCLLPALFGAVLGVYLALSTAYTLYLKRVVIVDVVVLAGLYTIRVLSGAIAVDAYVSPWLLGFCIFLFFSLALIKRYSEVSAMRQLGERFVNGRDYHFGDRDFLLSIGVASGYLSLLIFTLYLNSHEVILLYENSQYLWLICPLFLYWITRVWLLAYRGAILEDPLVFTLKDRASYAIGGAIGLITLLAL